MCEIGEGGKLMMLPRIVATAKRAIFACVRVCHAALCRLCPAIALVGHLRVAINIALELINQERTGCRCPCCWCFVLSNEGPAHIITQGHKNVLRIIYFFAKFFMTRDDNTRTDYFCFRSLFANKNKRNK